MLDAFELVCSCSCGCAACGGQARPCCEHGVQSCARRHIFEIPIYNARDTCMPWQCDAELRLLTLSTAAQMPEPAVCLYIYRDPVTNAMSLVENAKKSAQTSTTMPMTAERWLATWQEGASMRPTGIPCEICVVHGTLVHGTICPADRLNAAKAPNPYTKLL